MSVRSEKRTRLLRRIRGATATTANARSFALNVFFSKLLRFKFCSEILFENLEVICKHSGAQTNRLYLALKNRLSLCDNNVLVKRSVSQQVGRYPFLGSRYLLWVTKP